jgi:hypothetical protein
VFRGFWSATLASDFTPARFLRGTLCLSTYGD